MYVFTPCFGHRGDEFPNAYSIPNGCDINGEYSFCRQQDADMIFEKIKTQLSALCEKHGSFCAVEKDGELVFE